MTGDDPLALTDKFLATLDFERASAAKEEQHNKELTDLLLGLLDVADSLLDLEAHCRDLVRDGHERVPYRTVSLIARRMLGVLDQAQVAPVSPVGGPLDLERHQVTGVRNDPATEADTVLEETLRGYTWRNRPLRRAKVVVSGTVGTSGGSESVEEEEKQP